MQPVKLLALDSDLTVIKSMLHAQLILEASRKQDAPVRFYMGGKQTAIFTPKGENIFSVWEPDTSLGVPIEFQPSIVMSTTEAMKRLFALRKHFNAYWRD